MSSNFAHRLQARIRERLNSGRTGDYEYGFEEEERLADLLFVLLEDQLFPVKQENAYD